MNRRRLRRSVALGLAACISEAVALAFSNGLRAQPNAPDESQTLDLRSETTLSLDSGGQAGAWQITYTDYTEADLRNGALARADWQSAPTPANLHAIVPAPGEDDTVWYRREFRLAARPDRPVMLRLGEIADRDRVYLNGMLIGETGDWDAEKPQAYDRQRLYEVPPDVLRTGSNVLHVHVRGYFPDELGIYRGRTEVGAAREILGDYYQENLLQTLTLVAYFTLAVYFALFYFRRRQERENLYFALFLFFLVVYSFLRTQFKYELGWELHSTKRIQTAAVMLVVPFFYAFIRRFYQLPDARWRRIFDYALIGVHAIPAAGVVVTLVSDSTILWQKVLFQLVQPAWIAYSVAVLFILIRAVILDRSRDAALMLGAMALLLIALVLDVLSGRAIINLPTILTYAFTIFVLVMALVLANRFVRLHDETELLNLNLLRTNEAAQRFVPFEFLRLLNRGSIVDVNLGDQVQREMTVLFTDIRSFTTLSESMTPKENFDFINSYLRRMGPVIRDHRGFIDKYIGDAIMALFQEEADAALDAVISMQRATRIWNEKRVQHGYQAIRSGYGVHRGRLMLGTIGENERMEGTVISDAVNLAARIESLTKIYGTDALISQATRAALREPERFNLRFVDHVRVKGKSEAVSVYELQDGLPEEELQQRQEHAGRFEAAMQMLREGSRSEASEAFAELAARCPGDGLAQYYRDLTVPQVG